MMMMMMMMVTHATVIPNQTSQPAAGPTERGRISLLKCCNDLIYIKVRD